MTNENQIPIEKKLEGLRKLREPFKPHQISKLPKPTRRQMDEIKRDVSKGIRCKECGQWHHPKVIHLDYVGHAALTDRLLDCDPMWTWEPLALDDHGLPRFDSNGGMWIKLTVCGMTRLGYGDAQGKSGPNAVKEAIGDALRNAAMRFGAALDLWHKGELHVEDDADGVSEAGPSHEVDKVPAFDPKAAAERITKKIEKQGSLEDLKEAWIEEAQTIANIKAANEALFNEIEKAKDARKAELEGAPF